jgi:hypothetical protein
VDNVRAGIFSPDDGGLVSPEGETEGVSSVFGRPYRGPGGTIIIPVARVVQAQRAGARAGRVTTASPRAVIEVDEKGAHIKELTNTLLLSLAGMVLAAWNIFWITKTVRAFAKKR